MVQFFIATVDGYVRRESIELDPMQFSQWWYSANTATACFSHKRQQEIHASYAKCELDIHVPQSTTNINCAPTDIDYYDIEYIINSKTYPIIEIAVGVV